MIDGGMVSISSVKITPDLFEARIYLSLFQVKDVKTTMKKIEERALTGESASVIFCCDLNGDPKSQQGKAISAMLRNTRDGTEFEESSTVITLNPANQRFKGCLDHIFVTTDFCVKEFFQRDLKCVIPSEYEGSDHIWIFSELSL